MEIHSLPLSVESYLNIVTISREFLVLVAVNELLHFPSVRSSHMLPCVTDNILIYLVFRRNEIQPIIPTDKMGCMTTNGNVK